MLFAIPANDQTSHIEETVRVRLRELRAERGLTLAAVAAKTGLDTSTLSRLESGKRRLALDHIPALATALGVTTDELLTAPQPTDPRVHGKPIRRDRVTMWPLSREGNNGKNAYKLRIHANRRTPPAQLPVHEGHEWAYVLSGRLRLILGERDLVINPGEAVEFSTLVPHWIGAVEEPVELIAIFGPHGERVHVHD